MNKTELKILRELANGNSRIKDIATAVKKSEKQVYRANLEDFAIRERSKIEPKKATHASLLLQLLSEFPDLADLLSKSGIIILTSTLEPKTTKDISKETSLKKSIIYRKIRQAINISAISKQNKRYILNDKIWPKLKEFLIEFKNYQETIDNRIPANSVIYHKSGKEIVFSNRAEQDAALTAFSAYSNYGIKLLLPTNYYYLPKKKLSKKEVLIHSLYIAEKEKTIRHLTYTALFYIKFKIQCIHPILSEIKMLLKGKTIKGYPTLKEIKEKAELYDIRI